jgi:hypothetical protein
MLRDLKANQAIWVSVAGRKIRARVVETYHPRSGGTRVIVRPTESYGPFVAGALSVVWTWQTHWRNADHRGESRWLASRTK